MNFLLFPECMSIKYYKNKARLSPRGIQNNAKSMEPRGTYIQSKHLAPSAGKCTWFCEIKSPEKRWCRTSAAKLWCYPELPLTQSLAVSINEIYADTRQCVLRLLLRFISNFELYGCLRYIFIGEDFHNWPLILWSVDDSWRGSNANFLYFLIATESRPRPQTKNLTVSTLGSL